MESEGLGGSSMLVSEEEGVHELYYLDSIKDLLDLKKNILQ